MRWLRRRVEGRPVLGRAGVAWAGLGQWPAGHEAQLREAYAGNAVAQRAVRIVAEGCAGAPLAVTGEAAAGRLVAAAVEQAAADLLLHGNAYLQIGLDGQGLPAMLWPLRPERVTVETDAQGWPLAYRYRAGEVQATVAASDPAGRPGLVHVRALNPGCDHYGLGCLGAAMGPVAIHNAATRWNKALLDNAARPSGALVYDPGEAGAALTPDQFDRLREELEQSFAGAGNAGRPMLLEGGLRWQSLSLTPADMDFVGLKAAAAREIALAFGVPPMLLGLPGDSTHANYAEANRALWRLTILPMMAKLLGACGDALGRWWPGLALAVDQDGVPALAADRDRLWRQVTAAPFLTDREKRAALGFAPVAEGAA